LARAFDIESKEQVDDFGCVVSGQVLLIAELLDQVEFVHGVGPRTMAVLTVWNSIEY
jgi:hypothetical protein